MQGISTKVGAGAAAGALATVVWTILAASVDAIAAWPAETLATVTTGSATVVAFLAGYLIRETAVVTADDDAILAAIEPGVPVDNPESQ